MTAATAPLAASPLSTREVGWIWLRHLACLLIPGNALLFLFTGPHPWYVAPLFMVPLVMADQLDRSAKVELRQPDQALPAWPFDALVYLLAFMQLVSIVALGHMFSQTTVFSADMLMVLIVVGGNSGFSIITAHELIHRSKRSEQWLGRLLLCTVLYEHFYTEHLRGHHVRVGTAEDPATARFGESFRDFYRRTVPAQFRSAWRLEAKRLGDEQMSLLDARMIHNRILHGLAVGWGMAFGVYWLWGGVALVAFLLQAFFASRALEAVNYFEHWGLTRRKRMVTPVDSWDTHSWFTYYGLTGLSRHADHHAFPKRPFQQLRIWEEAPLLPCGYVGMVDMVMVRNREFQEQAIAELERVELGPFSPAASAEERASAEAHLALSARPPGALAKRWQALPGVVRVALVLVAIVTVTSVAASVEQGEPLSSVLARHTTIFAVLAGALLARERIEHLVHNGWVAWGTAIALFVALGHWSSGLL